MTAPEPTTADALAEAANTIVKTVGATVIVCFTMSGSTARRITRERPAVPVLVLTPKRSTARRMGDLVGAHAVQTRDVGSFEAMVAKAKRMVLRHGLAAAGDRLVLVAGVPFGVPGSTNVIHVVRLTGDDWRTMGRGESPQPLLIVIPANAGIQARSSTDRDQTRDPRRPRHRPGSPRPPGMTVRGTGSG